ncbi:hypothetical protein FKP32DRAFT_1601141 [Trametes sanguinea]|nr:hypothetical protein FKP32DRAFT_1601141 [Trametes sanguinea]
MAIPNNMVVYSPSPGTYVVMRLNPVETVRHLNDPIALKEAQEMRPKSHLVELSTQRIAIKQIWVTVRKEHILYSGHSGNAPCLRAEDPQKGLTADMCTPIFPNTHHPNGRAPVHPEPEGIFPYDNCFHWFQPVETKVRIRARPKEFDETNAVCLSPTALTRMDFSCWEEDGNKMCANLDALEALATTSMTKSGPLSVPTSQSDATAIEDGDSAFETMDYESYSDYGGGELGSTDPFSAPDEDVELVPLVDVWVSELADHLKQEDIPHPSDLGVEVEALKGIVQRARVRAYAALTAPPDATPNASQITKQKRFRPAKTWTKACFAAKRAATRFRSLLHTPLLPLWPSDSEYVTASSRPPISE